MSIFNKLKEKESGSKVVYNTGTILDIATGSFVPVGKKKHILNGGINMISAIAGREQTYKSTETLTYFGKLIENYPESRGVIYDTEFSIAGKERIMDLANITDREDFSERTVLVDKSDYDLDGFFELITEIEKEKIEHKADYELETPFLNAEGKFIRVLAPTFVVIDSWTAMTSAKEEEMFKGGKIDNTTNTSYMVDGNKKSKMMRQLPLISKRANIIFLLTAHIGSRIDMNMYAPSSKDLPMMRGSDKIKGVGSQFKFLTSNLIETRKVELVQDGNKKCFYSLGNSPAMELQLVTSIVCRCKNNMSGSMVPHIISQKYGIQSILDYYHIMRKAKVAPFNKNGVATMPVVDKSFSRNTIRQCIKDDAKFSRALEIIGQYHYTKTCMGWTFDSPTEKFIEALVDSDKTDAILASSGTWSFKSNKKAKPYMSILDIAQELNFK